ncbi:hypothetical protein LXA43DRAFT_880920 [Ganoderma leucocontextum]|nr:hypothetical protein LXA43DRAFT_880920 [Ganoderma leucocontextum]
MDSPLASETPSAVDDRIFFGPLQSPEKKFALSLYGPKFRTPVRRSTRLSSAMVPLPLFSEEQEPGPSSTREGTPEEDTIPDEPSVILASRVLSACSNPSPPPSPPLTAKNHMSEPDDIQHFDLLGSSWPPNALDGALIPLDGLAEPIMSSSPFLPRVSTPTQQHTSQANTSQPDLIAFDSFSTPNASHINALSGSAPLHDTLAQPTTPSVDDLLAMSPRPSLPIVHDQQTDVPEHSEPVSPTATLDEGMEVATSFVGGVERSPSPTPLIQVAAPKEATALESTSSSEDASTPKEETPPLRRSSRPRKSRSSLPQTIANTSLQPPLTKQQSTEPECSGAEQSDEQRNTQRKRKLRHSPKPEDKGEGTSTNAPTTPRRLPQVACLQRELGSLSPMSTAVLSQLFANVAAGSASGSATPLPPQIPQDDGGPRPGNVLAPAPKTPPQQTPSFIFPKVGPSGDPASGAQRPRSPLRPFSPSRFGEGSRTPARRVPIAQAVAEGTYSPNQLPSAFGTARPTNAPGSPVFKKLALDDPLRSPAKRVPMNEAVPAPPPSPGRPLDKGKGKSIPRLQSPVRASSVPRQRSTSVEPQPLPRRERGASAEPAPRQPALGRRPLFQKPASSDGVPGSAIKPNSGLPFPLVPGQQQRVPSIPEGEESCLSPTRLAPRAAVGAGSRGTSAAAASPAKQGSSLRQPSAGSGSKIPRIGAKPYARPRSATSVEAASKFPASTKSSLTSSKTKPLRIVHVGSSSGSSSDEGPTSSNAPAVIPASTLKPRRALGVQSSSSSVEAVPATGSKRKREVEPSSAKPTAPASHQKIVMRKVVPGMFNKGKEATNIMPVAEQTTPVLASPTKVPGPIKARSAVGWKRPQQEPIQLLPPPPAAVPASTLVPPVAPKEPSREPVPPSAVPIMKPEPENPVVEALAVADCTPDVATQTVPAAVIPSAETTAESVVRQLSTRRSTRPRRGTTTATDVFGTVAATSSITTTQRRRGPLPSETNGPFAGMSALALKTLTSTNTARNQQQVAAIQTEVIRKEGSRPDSPTTRVRTTLEQQKEARVQQRQERAARRARRSAGSDIEVESGVPADGAGDAGEDGAGDVSAMSVDEEGLPLRHRRGPGDEEDYETPPRPERPIKRLRLHGGEDGEDEWEKARDVLAKRVKWDKGLHTMVFLDDTPPKPKWDTKAVPSSKSCLTPAAKALRLDTLGNVLNAEIAVGGLVKENIIVKKFVFDDDELPQEVEVVPAPTPAVKSTRSKSKKAKS